MPIKTATQGQPISVTLKVADESGIDNAIIVVNGIVAGQNVERILPLKSSFTSETMKIKVISNVASVFSGPSSLTDVLLSIDKGQLFDVFTVRKDLGFYQIMLDNDIEGWVSTEAAVPELVGDIYTATIPVEMTFSSELHYYASVENKLHNKTSTSAYTVGIISREEDKPIIAEQELPQRPQPVSEIKESTSVKRPFFTSAWFIGGVAVVGAGTAVLLLSKKKTETGAISIIVEW